MPEPEWVPVTSSNIDAARYDPESKTLTIRFQNGREYGYSGVPVEVAQALIHADSPGRFFNREIKGNYRDA